MALFATAYNSCYRVNPSAGVSEIHQQEYCLLDTHLTCPIFNQPENAFSSDFILPKRESPQANKSLVSAGLIITVFLLILSSSAWAYRKILLNHQAVGQASLVKTSLALFTQTQIEQTKPVAQAISSQQATVFPSVTRTPVPTSKTPLLITLTPTRRLHPGLGTPIGHNPSLVIHRIALGENLATLATKYGTTEIAILSINLNLPIPIWENWLVVIPYQTQVVAGLPLFEVYQVSTSGVTPAALAQQFNVNQSLLEQYNNLTSKDSFLEGQWVLIPHTHN